MVHLKSTLSLLLSEAPSKPYARDFLDLCHRMAIVCLRKKVKCGPGNPVLGSLSLEDLAWDCIADLFERNDSGEFIKLVAYYRAVAWESKCDDELEGATRRLIFSQVNQALCRIYREADPSLGKLLRNLKMAVKSSPIVTLIHCERETWIWLREQNGAGAFLPAMPPEFLEAHLLASLRGEPDLKQILSLVVEILNNQPTYRKGIPLTGFALVIRSAFTHLNHAWEKESDSHDSIAQEEIETMISTSVDKVKSNMHSTYVAKQKIHDSAYHDYFLAIRDMLTTEYVRNDGMNRSYYDYLRRHLQSLTREDYQRQCRCHFEYLAKLTRQELLRQLKKEW